MMLLAAVTAPGTIDTSHSGGFPTWALVAFGILIAVVLLSWVIVDLTKEDK